MRAAIGLGANLGDRGAALQGALDALASAEGVRVAAVSSLYETAPIGGPDGQGRYLNAAALLETTLAPHALLDLLQRVEADFHRERVVRWGPRTLDLDILFYGDAVIEDARLTVPHPRAHGRRFVLAPLADVAPDLEHPTLRRSVRALLAAQPVEDDDIRRMSLPESAAQGWRGAAMAEGGVKDQAESADELGLITPEFLAPLWAAHAEAITAPIRPLDFPRFGLRFEDRAHQMGVINLSRDSSYRESIALSVDQAVRRGRKMALDGAAIIDIGAESTGHGTARVDADGQNTLLEPVVRGLAEHRILVSIDTYLPEVAEAGLKAGAGVINLTGRNDDPAFYRMIARAEAGVILCYTPGEHGRSEDVVLPSRDDLVAAQLDYLRDAAALAERCGVERIWVDPGMGVGYYHLLPDGPRRIRHQVENTLQAFRFRAIGWPVCVTMASPVAMFGDEVRSAETCFATLAMLSKVNLLRSHEAARVQPVLDTQHIRRDLP